MKQYGCFKLVHIFSEKLGRLSSAGAEFQAFVRHCSVNFELILDCFIPNFKLKYEDSENIKADCVNAVIFNLQQIKRRAFFLGHRMCYSVCEAKCRFWEQHLPPSRGKPDSL